MESHNQVFNMKDGPFPIMHPSFHSWGSKHRLSHHRLGSTTGRQRRFLDPERTSPTTPASHRPARNVAFDPNSPGLDLPIRGSLERLRQGLHMRFVETHLLLSETWHWAVFR